MQQSAQGSVLIWIIYEKGLTKKQNLKPSII